MVSPQKVFQRKNTSNQKNKAQILKTPQTKQKGEFLLCLISKVGEELKP